MISSKSEQAFEKALSIDPHHVKSLVNLSRVFIDQKRHDEAVDRLTRASEIEPESAEVYRLLGRTYHTQRKTDEAVAAYRQAIDLDERDAWSMNNLGLLLLETKRADEALPLLTRPWSCERTSRSSTTTSAWRSSTPGVSGPRRPRTARP